MEPQNTQQNMNPEDAKASLGIATYLQDQMLMSQAPQEQGMEETGENPQNPQGGNDQVGAIMKELASIKKEIKQLKGDEDSDRDLEIEDLKREIEEVLNSNG